MEGRLLLSCQIFGIGSAGNQTELKQITYRHSSLPGITLIVSFFAKAMKILEPRSNLKYKDREVSSFFFVHCFNYYKYVWYCNHKFASVLIRGPVQGLDSQFDICLRTQLDETDSSSGVSKSRDFSEAALPSREKPRSSGAPFGFFFGLLLFVALFSACSFLRTQLFFSIQP